MPTSAIIMFLVTSAVLFGGLAICIIIAIKKKT
jgi:hypothetical protein